MKKLNIAIDGPSAAGKSTVAKLVAQRLGVLHLNTGSLYRALTYSCINSNIDCNDNIAVISFLRDVKVTVNFIKNQQHTYVNGKDVTEYLRDEQISRTVSKISKIAKVREKITQTQKDIANKMDVVMEGRDIGSVILPEAKYKFFITASSEERAKRRYQELLGEGKYSDYETIKTEIIKRDYEDSHREVSPLIKAKDAIEIDTSDLDIDEVVDKVLSYIKIK